MADSPYEQSPYFSVPGSGSEHGHYSIAPDGHIHGRFTYGSSGVVPDGYPHHEQPQQLMATDSTAGKAANEAWALYSGELQKSRDPNAAMKLSEEKLKGAVEQTDDQFNAAAGQYKAVSTDEKVDAAIKQAKMDAIDLQTALDQLQQNDPQKAKRDSLLMMALQAGFLKDGDPVTSAAKQDLKADGVWDAYNRQEEDEKNPDVVRAINAWTSMQSAGMDAAAAHQFYATALHQTGRWPEEQKLRESYNALAAMLGSAQPGQDAGQQNVYRPR